MIQRHRYRIAGGNVGTAGRNRKLFTISIIGVPAWTHPVIIDNIKGRVSFLVVVLGLDPGSGADDLRDTKFVLNALNIPTQREVAVGIHDITCWCLVRPSRILDTVYINLQRLVVFINANHMVPISGVGDGI